MKTERFELLLNEDDNLIKRLIKKMENINTTDTDWTRETYFSDKLKPHLGYLGDYKPPQDLKVGHVTTKNYKLVIYKNNGKWHN